MERDRQYGECDLIILTDTNCVIQAYFLLGKAAFLHTKAPQLEIHEYVRDEIVGLGKNKSHLKDHWKDMLEVFPVTKLTADHYILVDEIEYLESQFDLLKLEGKILLGKDPGNIDYTQLALAKIQDCGLATLEHSLLQLALIVHTDKVMTLYPLVKRFFDAGIVTKSDIQNNLNNFPSKETLRNDDLRDIKEFLKVETTIEKNEYDDDTFQKDMDEIQLNPKNNA